MQRPVKDTIFRYSAGVAKEFRVAAQNKHGIGEFTRCKPSCGISDEIILPADREELKNKTETFAQMMNVEKIIVRLSTRRVLRQDVQERLSHRLMEYGPFQGARTLLEEILRCNYKQLFLFRKTLEEFGQESLADLVPVKNADDPAFDEEHYVVTTQTLQLPTPLQEDILREDAVQSRADQHVEVYNQRNPDSLQTSRTGDIMRNRKRHGPDNTDNNTDHQTKRIRGQYTLLQKLTREQKSCCPEERLFGKIVCCLERIHSLGNNLGFNMTEIKGFQHDNPSSIEAQALEMLVTWREKNVGRATMKRLVKAMEDSKIPEECYKEAVLGYFRDSDTDSESD